MGVSSTNSALFKGQLNMQLEMFNYSSTKRDKGHGHRRGLFPSQCINRLTSQNFLEKKTRNYLKTETKSHHCSWKHSHPRGAHVVRRGGHVGSLPRWVSPWRSSSPRCTRKWPWWQVVALVQLEAQPNQTHATTLHLEKPPPVRWWVGTLSPLVCVLLKNAIRVKQHLLSGHSTEV